MKSAVYSALAAALVILPFTNTTARGEGLLGTNYAGAVFGVIKPGDDAAEDFYDQIYSAGVFGNIKIGEQLDLRPYVSHLWADGESGGYKLDVSTTQVGADVRMYMEYQPNLMVYASGGLFFNSTEVELKYAGTSTSDDDTDIGFSGDVGIESTPSESIVYRAALTYSNVSGDDATGITLGAGKWLRPTVLGALQFVYDFEDGDAGIGINLIVKL